MRFEERIGLRRFFDTYEDIRIQPSSGDVLRLEGELQFQVQYGRLAIIQDSYDLHIAVPRAFPRKLPEVYELNERIDRHLDNHVYEDGSLCLGSPLRLFIIANERPDLTAFIESAIIPYLYGASYRRIHGTYPFGELMHGTPGLLHDYAEILGLKTSEQVAEALALLGMKRRLANKYPCPCGCGRRLGVCNLNKTILSLRRMLGRPLVKRLIQQL